MASLLFRPINFYSSSRHPSHFDVDIDPFSRGVSPTSSPFPMSPAGTSNPYGNAADLPTPPPLSMGELAVKFGEQSLQHPEESAYPTSNPSLGPSQLHHSLPTPPSEEDCIPNDVSGGLPARHRLGSTLSRTQYSSPRRRSSSSDRASDSMQHYPSSSTSASVKLTHLSTPAMPHTANATSFPPAGDYEDFMLSPTSHELEPWDLRRRRSTSALRPVYWSEAVVQALGAVSSRPSSSSLTSSSGRGRGRRFGEDRRRGDDCGISKAGRYRRVNLSRRGAISS
jgi:hypothetical protein